MRHRPFILLLLSLFIFGSVRGQEKFWVFFKDKGPEAEWLMAHPETFLSQKALENRALAGLAIDGYDLPVSSTYLRELQASGAGLERVSRWMNAVSIRTDLSLCELQGFCPSVREMKRVARLVTTQKQEAFVSPPMESPLPEAKKVNSAFDYGLGRKQAEMLGLDCLHDRGITGRGVLIALFDAGFYNADTIDAFDSLWINNRILHWWDFVDGDSLVFQENSHGMSVLSTIAANAPGSLVGTAPHASFLLARTEQVASETHAEEDNWLAGMEWADSLGADIIHSSLGYSTFDPGEGDYTYNDMNGDVTIISVAADIAASRGILVNSSAGNEGNSGWNYITAPCDADSILCVGAVDSSGIRASFSSVGPTSDLRIKPDVMALGENAAVVTSFGFVFFSSGTSFSAPIMAGFAACLRQAHPDRSNMEIIHAIRQSADRFTQPDTAYGYGIPNACIADSLLSVMDSVANDLNPSEAHKWLQIFPNPASDELFIRDLAMKYDLQGVEIRTSAGALVRKEASVTGISSLHQINIKDLSSGLYFLRVNIRGEGLVSFKFILE